MSFTEAFATTAAAVVGLGADATALAALPDDSLLAALALVTEHRRTAELYTAWLAGEIAARSTREAGHSGLAQRNGFGGAEGLLQSLAPLTRGEAAQLVAAGTMMATPARSAWEQLLSTALTDGAVPVAAVEAIRAGLAPIADSAPAEDLARECERLLTRAALVSVDELRREARTARDRIDEAGIARRELERRDRRYLKRWVRDDGMYQGAFLLDPENGLRLFTALDAIIAPRRGVRFVDDTATVSGQAVIDDPRTDEQLLADSLIEIVQTAIDADPSKLFGARRPAVRVIVTEQTLAGASGHGFLEGDSQPVSRSTIERFVCDTGMIGIKFDRHDQILDLGRTQRLFTEPQRLAISIRDGGCLFPNCTRPPSGCEVHHINQWQRDHGHTNVTDGVLLCRHHHMLLHNNHWNIHRHNHTYWLTPPTTIDRTRTPIALVSKSPLMRELTRH